MVHIRQILGSTAFQFVGNKIVSGDERHREIAVDDPNDTPFPRLCEIDSRYGLDDVYAARFHTDLEDGFTISEILRRNTGQRSAKGRKSTKNFLTVLHAGANEASRSFVIRGTP